MPQNISLILAGAVSLGSFEAGALDEILYVLDGLNRRGGDRYVIDSIAGASAGAMTGALVAQAVMRGFDRRRLLHEAWVERIDITRLLDGIPDNALLSKRAIQEIGAELLPYRGTLDDAPSSLAGDTLRLAFTVTNITGVDYRLARSSDPDDDGAFESTFYAERREFVLHRDAPADDRWHEIREAAIASGNFPMAFAAHPLMSVRENWPGCALDPFPDYFWYVDGGMFNNEPVGEAVRLARLIDDPGTGARIDPRRRFILVDANLNSTAHDPGFSDRSPLPDTAKRLAVAMMGEATANDWLKALRRNTEVGWRDRLVGTLADLVGRLRVDDPDGLLRQLELAAEDVVARKRALLGHERYPADYRARAVARLNAEHVALTRDMRPRQREAFGNLVFLVNSVAGLDRKRHLDLSMIHTDGHEVAGDQLHSFAGFFHRDWRQHDYVIGRAKARNALPTILGIPDEELPPPEPGVPYLPEVDLCDVTMANAPRPAREHFRDATMRKVTDATRDLSFGPAWLRWGLGPLARLAVRKTARTRLEAMLEL
ncbi:MAG: patatin-like phospholipase family protein [Gemmatimonadota bacterium]